MGISAADLRRLALALPKVTEGSHDGLPTFKVGGKRFATLGWPDARSASLHLSVDDQEMLVAAEPAIFRPVPGGFGRLGHTIIDLAGADAGAAQSALHAAWRKTAPPRLAKAMASTGASTDGSAKAARRR